jgi:hypothetical protein
MTELETMTAIDGVYAYYGEGDDDEWNDIMDWLNSGDDDMVYRVVVSKAPPDIKAKLLELGHDEDDEVWIRISV